MIRWIFLVAWTMHGLGHAAGLIAVFAPDASGFNLDQPWLLPGDVSVTSPIGKLWGLLWAAALALIVASSWGLYADAEWWRQAALLGGLVSLVAIVPWARTVVPGALAGAVFSAATIVMLLVPLRQLLDLVEK